MHFRRSHPRMKSKRSRTSKWSYPQTESGDQAQSRYSTALRTAAANDELKMVANPYWDETDWWGYDYEFYDAGTWDYGYPSWDDILSRPVGQPVTYTVLPRMDNP